MRALVLGGTGAIGEEVVKQLLDSTHFTKVITLGRREVKVEAAPDALQKLEHHSINMDKMETEAPSFFEGVDTVFCGLGTTRGVAGSAEAFKKVDYEYVATGASIAKKAGVKHFSLVSAQGANAKLWANDVGLFHFMLYTKTKGLAEEAVKAQGFERVSIYRPGMLDRGDKLRAMEKFFLPVLPAIKVADVARFMVQDALLPSKEVPAVAVYEMRAMQAAAKKNVLPKPS